MKAFLFLLISCGFSLSIQAQDEEPQTKVERLAEFPGGQSALNNYLANNIRIPDIALENGISGQVLVQFVVSKKGKVSNIKILKGMPDCPECETEVMRILEHMPKWKPAKNGNRKVACYFKLPVSFVIQ